MKLLSTLLASITRWFARRRSADEIVLVLLAVFVGLSSGIGVWLFKQMIDLFQHLAFGVLLPGLRPLGRWSVALLPALGGLLVGGLAHRFIGPERHHGVAGIIESVALAGGRLPFARLPFKAVAAALSIGSGASVGPEDPSVQIGSNLGAMIGRALRLSDERNRSLVAAGAAGGIAAAFNAPIAGVFFALEIILGELSGAALSVVVLSAVISAVFTQAVSGSQPAFQVAAYTLQSVWELPLYLVLGLLAGLVAALYGKALDRARGFFKKLALPAWLKPAAAGLVVGAVGIFLPQVFGVGYETITAIFTGAPLPILLLIALLLAKLVLTPLSIGGGFQGGVFAPALFLGAALGAAFGQACQALLPALQVNPPAFAMVGMAAVLAGAVHAPLTAILLLFEMTNDYRIILPLMFAVIISLLVSQRLQRESVYTLSLLRRGIRLERGRDVEVMEGLSVGEIMSTDFHTLQAGDTLLEAARRFSETHSHGFPVLDLEGELIGMFTLSDLETAQKNESDLAARRVGEFCTRGLVVAYPDETIGAALHRMSVNDLGRLPVLARGDPLHIIGLLRRADVIRAYDLALSRRAAARHRQQEVRLGALSQLGVAEERVEPGSPAAGRQVGEVAWPAGVVIASVRRGRQVLAPHGGTQLRAGDVVVFVAEDEDSADLARRLCRPPL